MIPATLVDQIAQRRCALFLGPDASETAGGYRGLPTSWQLADELAAQINYRRQYRPLPQIAQLYEHARGRNDLLTFLRNRLDDSHLEPLPLHELIVRIPFAAIVDASWDRLLERALRKHDLPYQVIQSVHDLPYALPSNQTLLYKPYGSLDRPETLVITEDDQLNVFYQLQGLKRRLVDLLASHTLLMVGYAPDYDSVFVRIYHEIRQEQGAHRPPALVVESVSRPEDALQWDARGITPVVAEPAPFLHELASTLALRGATLLDLPPVEALSDAPAVTEADLREQTSAVRRVLETAGIAELVEQSDVPLLSAAQVRDLEAMRAAYERLAASLAPTPSSADIWLRQGNLEYTRENFDKAQHYYDMALAAQPQLGEAYHNLHYLYLAQGRLSEAFQAYRRAVELKPELALLPERYEVDAILGRGGMGVVYRALDHETGQTVAIKVLDRAHVGTERVVARFRREAEILSRLKHPNIVSLLAFEQYQGHYYLVMEYAGEETLARRLERSGRLDLDEAGEILGQACRAVSFAHGQHIIHRDIKPANLFIINGRVKLIDFGLAADLQAGQPSSIGLATGTVAYMSPEQVAGGTVDERTDVYALGTLFHEMLTGQNPAQGAYRPPSALLPGLNYTLDVVIQRARERTPEARYPSADEFCGELARVIPAQAASRRSRPGVRALARLQNAITRIVPGEWPLIVVAVVVAGLLLPLTLPAGAGRAALRVTGLLIWDAFALVFLAEWFASWLAQRTGYASLAAYAPVMALTLGVIIGLLNTFLFTDLEAFALRDRIAFSDYFVLMLAHTVAIVVVGNLSFLALASGGRMGARLRFGAGLRFGPSAGYLLVLLVLLAYVILMQATGFWLSIS
jgi:tetratricopeptide (TPR) repeat protein